VVNGRILPIDLDFCEAELMEFFSSTENQPALAARCNAGPLANEFHRIELEPCEPGLFGVGGRYVLMPVSDDAGDAVEDLDEIVYDGDMIELARVIENLRSESESGCFRGRSR
jgi:hypothetical protein